VDEFAKSLEDRIQALARSQDTVVHGAWRGTLLDAVIRDALAPHASRDGRIDIRGPAIEVDARELPLLHMAFHELATNAVKYGSLSAPRGKVDVEWKTIADEQGEAVLLTWAEHDGPVVEPPVQRGFGSTLIEHALARQFEGNIELTFPAHGVVCTMRLPLSDRLTLQAVLLRA
jgi:two-component system CheB/CheR fusion protein